MRGVLRGGGHVGGCGGGAGGYVESGASCAGRGFAGVRVHEHQCPPANRVAAAGYGEFQPLDAADNDDARRKNRRIELKITQRVAVK